MAVEKNLGEGNQVNLLSAPWLAFKRRNGEIEYRPPTAIADPEVIELAMPRADFQGAAYQWLIGLLQNGVCAERSLRLV